MNRLTALTIEHTQEIENYLIEKKISYEIADKCQQLDKHVIFIDKPFILLLDFEPNIIANFKAYYDTGDAEILVKNNDYKLYDEVYLVRTGKYDPIIEDELI